MSKIERYGSVKVLRRERGPENGAGGKALGRGQQATETCRMLLEVSLPCSLFFLSRLSFCDCFQEVKTERARRSGCDGDRDENRARRRRKDELSAQSVGG